MQGLKLVCLKRPPDVREGWESDGKSSTQAPPALRPALAGAPSDYGARHPPPAGVELRRPSQVLYEKLPDAQWWGALECPMPAVLPARLPSLWLYGQRAE